MASTTEPTEPPPSYTAATSPIAARPTTQDASHLQVPHKTRSGIPPNARRSMEDESRELPSGWVRQYDAQSHHQFFVDTKSDPPRSIWHHPYDDDTYLNTLSSQERERIKNLHHPMPNRADMEAESSADDHDYHDEGVVGGGKVQEHLSGPHKFGRKMKDKLTGSTHEEREASRRKREEEERKMYAQHQHIRRQMALAAETGQPQLLGKDSQGKDVYIEPPSDPYGGGYGGGFGGFGGYSGGRGYGYSPYGSQGVYNTPNARYIRPQQPYGRPYGYGYGGGYGLPIGLGLGGGLLLGGLLF
ncbi:uncharacterized protein PAC_10496 [Phialocephala subalpina]|uniref:WW domain-containing protein n=1 Tax=Phialocephala subalpina TaxID=576137 RepID=A0A1L7X6F1_9HELO|nr:uncharacterized protein PAC_10496 [Phialocephala subalpina]